MDYDRGWTHDMLESMTALASTMELEDLEVRFMAQYTANAALFEKKVADTFLQRIRTLKGEAENLVDGGEARHAKGIAEFKAAMAKLKLRRS